MSDDDAMSDVVTVQEASDPDAQATVTDFLDYTEYLPSDLIRSLTLVRKLDETYHTSTEAVHELTKTLGALPKLPANERPDAQNLRSQISQNLNRAIATREASHAEASRLWEVVDHHYNRLNSIIAKLHALPKPPSREPTPAPEPVSPTLPRSRGGRKTDVDGTPPTRITLRLDGARAATGAQAPGSESRHKRRPKKITVPGEVLPPYNPDSPSFYTASEDDWESAPPSPVPEPTIRVGAPSARKSGNSARIKAPKPPKVPKIKSPKVPRQRPHGVMGTNVHSAVAGISSSNALALLKPPPENPVLGSEDAPWFRLTEWEMAKLRKRMKKNAVWTPSDTMIRRELSERGRGPENYRLARSRAETSGDAFVDDSKPTEPGQGKKVLAPGEISADALGEAETQLSNRGMKLNEAKKLKKENLAREQAALAAAEAGQTTQRSADGDEMDVDDANAMDATLQNNIEAEITKTKAKEKQAEEKATKKRKREASREEAVAEIPEASTAPAPAPDKPSNPKKRRTTAAPPAPISTGTTITIPLAAPGAISKSTTPALPSPSEIKRTATSSRPRRTSTAAKTASPEATLPSRPLSRGKLTSAEPAAPTSTREHLRRARTLSAPPLPSEPVPARRRSKRPAPGPVTASTEGGAAVSVGRRKAAPRKKVTGAAATTATTGARKSDGKGEEKMEDLADEIDPDEPRYCLCGDVSFGTMICCENSDCEREWFHLSCVGLSEPPGRTTKWYCPACRKGLGISTADKGIVPSGGGGGWGGARRKK